MNTSATTASPPASRGLLCAARRHGHHLLLELDLVDGACNGWQQTAPAPTTTVAITTVPQVSPERPAAPNLR